MNLLMDSSLQTRAKAVLTTVVFTYIATPIYVVGIVVIVVPLALLIALLTALNCAWWHSRGRRFHAGRVLATRWIVLPSAVRGRTIAVRKDMRVAVSGRWWWSIQCSTYLESWSWSFDMLERCHLIPDPPLLHRTGRIAHAHTDFTSLPPAAALSIVQGCRSCHGLPLEKDDVFDALLAESSAAAHLAAARIQRAWRGAIADPKRAVCRARVMREFVELAHLSGADLV
jgi:hypothetical protein